MDLLDSHDAEVRFDNDGSTINSTSTIASRTLSGPQPDGVTCCCLCLRPLNATYTPSLAVHHNYPLPYGLPYRDNDLGQDFGHGGNASLPRDIYLEHGIMHCPQDTILSTNVPTANSLDSLDTLPTQPSDPVSANQASAPCTPRLVPGDGQTISRLSAAISFKCSKDNCAEVFKRNADRTRHEDAVHARLKHLCPIPGCPKGAGQGYHRRDKLTEHLWKKHGDLGFVKRARW